MADIKILDPILITGPPRSGTSMVAGIIHLCGAWGGEMIGPHPENPKGFFENKTIKKTVFEPYLFGMDYDLLGKREIPAYRINRRIPRLREKIHQILINEGYEGGLWFYKNPMICLIWHAWAAAFPDAVWVITKRDPEENAESCMATSWMGGLSTKEQWVEYVEEYNRRAWDAYKEANPNKSNWLLEPADAIRGELNSFETAVGAFGIEWDEKKVKEFIDPEAWG